MFIFFSIENIAHSKYFLYRNWCFTCKVKEDAVKEKLVVTDGKAMYGDKVLACAAGDCTAPETPSGSSIK